MITLDRIKSICVCLMKQCDSHVYRAMRDQRKNMNKPPMEMRIYKDQIDRINLHIASSLRNLSRIVDVIARLNVMIAIYELQTLPCECFDLNSTTNEHHDSALSESIAQTMHRILEEEIGAMMLDNDDQLDALVQEELREIGTSEIRQRFKVCNTIRKVVERIKKDVPLAFVRICPRLTV